MRPSRARTGAYPYRAQQQGHYPLESQQQQTYSQTNGDQQPGYYQVEPQQQQIYAQPYGAQQQEYYEVEPRQQQSYVQSQPLQAQAQGSCLTGASMRAPQQQTDYSVEPQQQQTYSQPQNPQNARFPFESGSLARNSSHASRGTEHSGTTRSTLEFPAPPPSPFVPFRCDNIPAYRQAPEIVNVNDEIDTWAQNVVAGGTYDGNTPAGSVAGSIHYESGPGNNDQAYPQHDSASLGGSGQYDGVGAWQDDGNHQTQYNMTLTVPEPPREDNAAMVAFAEAHHHIVSPWTPELPAFGQPGASSLQVPGNYSNEVSSMTPSVAAYDLANITVSNPSWSPSGSLRSQRGSEHRYR